MEENKDKSERAQREEEILAFWKENKIFKKTLEKPARPNGRLVGDSPKGEFVFYEGPPTANGRPGIHHLEARAFKDAIPRYKTMRGFHVPRRAGWDTHGLPVELDVEKKLGLKSKKEIEEYGVAKFNEECRRSVWSYLDEWRRFTDRVGYWVDLDDAYVTYRNTYIESVWNIIAHVEKRGLLYKDYKVVPWCPRCGTALSSHELAQGYKDVKDLSVYAKFRIKDFDKAYFLAWTTTPWTLPGNVALAVGEDIVYVEAKVGEEIFVLAKNRLEILGAEYEIVAEHKGSEMVGMAYEPLYPFLKESYKGDGLENAYKVYAADFVNTEDGTGMVHTAVMYGQDDFELGTKENLPKHHMVDDSGHFIRGTGFLEGRFVKDEETSIEIIKDLAARELLFKKEKHEHSYPHCWRCKTPLIYYARDSWYIRMSELRDKLLKENEKVNWEPDHIKHGRFGEWLSEVKDWALSRERYWGTPLPVWQTLDGEKRIVADSIATLRSLAKRSGNRYMVMRHGESTHNLDWRISTRADNPDKLTEKGRKQVQEAAEKLKSEKIDMLVISPFVRTRESAEIMREVLGLHEDSVVIDERLRELGVHSYEGKTWEEYHKEFPKTKEFFDAKKEGDESYREVKRRVMEMLYEYEEKYKGKHILFITHGSPAWLLSSGSEGLSADLTYAMIKEGDTHLDSVLNGEVRELDFVPMPHDADYELDLHKPYIDDLVLEKDGEDYMRTKEVMDVWLDSGAMPFAQIHYPFGEEEVRFPADFIAEAIDQTRGWFYTLHAVGVLMERGHAYKNVISLGHILDKEGKKMSKSVGNVLDPWEMADRYGIDTLRLWMYSVNQPGESKNFDERSVDDIQKKVFNILDNVRSFLGLYVQPDFFALNPLSGGSDATQKSSWTPSHILDRWIVSRLGELVHLSTSRLDEYKLLEPVRAIREFIDDLSTWYLRRSRERIKSGDEDSVRCLHYVLVELSKLIAPFAPFYAEDMYRELRSESDPLSVHLTSWPEEGTVEEEVIELMKEVRNIVSQALEQRSRANIKVRQPLNKLEVRSLKLEVGYQELIKDEVNVKEVVGNPGLEAEVSLDTSLTPELEEEGRMRDLVRSIQDMRKERGLKPGEPMKYEVKEEEMAIFKKFGDEIKRATDIEV